jgi:iron(III) transport system substrate-binding protein
MPHDNECRRAHPLRALSRCAAAGAALLIAGAGAAAAQGAASPSDIAAPPALVKAAQKEGGITLYSSSDVAQSKALLAAFKKKYGIPGTFLRLPTTPLLQRFATELDGHADQADVLSVSSPIPYRDHPEWFAPLDAKAVPNLAGWPSKWVSGNTMVWSTDLISVAYNTSQVPKGQVPKTWQDLLNPKWKGKVVLDDPRSADNYMAWLNTLERIAGADFIRKIPGIDFKLTSSGANGAQMVAAGAYAMNWPTFQAFSNTLIKKGAPIAVIGLTDPTLVSARQIGIVSKAPHPNAARLFLSWVLSREGVRATCAASPETVVADPDGKLGCIPASNPQPIEFVNSDARRHQLLSELGLSDN